VVDLSFINNLVVAVSLSTNNLTIAVGLILKVVVAHVVSSYSSLRQPTQYFSIHSPHLYDKLISFLSKAPVKKADFI
jgi:hypothetical protein